MAGVVADTHALVWYLVEPSRLSPAASAALDRAVDAGEAIYISAISLVELVYLVEKGRLPRLVIERLQTAVAAAEAEISVVALDADLAWRVAEVSREGVPELPDRIIAATAVQLELPLVTRDLRIQASGVEAIW